MGLSMIYTKITETELFTGRSYSKTVYLVERRLFGAVKNIADKRCHVAKENIAFVEI